MKYTALLFAALGLLPALSGAWAQATVSCSTKRTACETACTGQWGESGFGRAGCIARCTADLAVCESEQAARDGQQLWQQEGAPWIDRRQREADDFLRGLRGPQPAPQPPAEAPPAAAPPPAGGRGI